MEEPRAASESATPWVPEPSPGEASSSESLPGDAKLGLQASAYDCDHGMYVVAEMRSAERMVLYLPRGPLEMERQASASGSLFAEGEASFWIKGSEARLELWDRETATCRENRRRSIVETAKLEGVTHFASGNEPGWTLRILPQRTVLITDYGATTVQVPTPEPIQEGGVTTFEAETEAHNLRVTFDDADAPCLDDMSGEEFPLRVVLTLDGRGLRGCGEALNDSL